VNALPTRGELIRDIESRDVRAGELAFWWLGQHGFALKAGEHVIYIDPFLTDLPGRLVPPLLLPADIRHARIVCGSHDHADHIDRDAWPALARSSPGATFIVPELLRERLASDLAIDAGRFVGLDDGASVEIEGMRITGIAAAHESLDQDPSTGRFPHLGFVFEANGCTFYHSGDTCIYTGLAAKLSRWRFDIMFLPINGRDAGRRARGCVGNMTCEEAADLAGPLAPAMVVPTHYDMFAMNAGDPEAFRAYMNAKYPEQQVCICEHAKAVTSGKA